MSIYLRFTPDEFRALTRVCQSIRLTSAFVPLFKCLLVEALYPNLPALADRIAGFSRAQVDLLYRSLRERQEAEIADRVEPKATAWTPQELRAICQAALAYQPANRLLPPFQEFLVRQVRKTFPALARKIERLSPQQVERLYDGARGS